MNVFARIALAATLSLAATVSLAQTPPAIPAEALHPNNGLWLSDAKPNHGWTLEVSPSGFMFVTVFTYAVDGTPTFLTLQGQYTPTPGDVSGNLGRFTSPVFRTVGGAPIDSLAQPAVTATPQGEATITFHSGRRATWSYGANTFALVSLQDYPGINAGFKLPEYFAGNWMVATKIRRSNGSDSYETHFIRLTDAGTVAGKRVFNASCIDRCLVETNPTIFTLPPSQGGTMYVDAQVSVVAALRITYDPATGQLRSQSTNPDLKFWNQDLLVVTPNEVQGRVYLNPDGTQSDGGPFPSGDSIEGLRFIRMPPNFQF